MAIMKSGDYRAGGVRKAPNCEFGDDRLLAPVDVSTMSARRDDERFSKGTRRGVAPRCEAMGFARMRLQTSSAIGTQGGRNAGAPATPSSRRSRYKILVGKFSKIPG